MGEVLERLLREYVNDPHFFNSLKSEIDQLDKPGDRLKARLELLSYVVPKVKGVDSAAADANAPITVTFQETGGEDK